MSKYPESFDNEMVWLASEIEKFNKKCQKPKHAYTVVLTLYNDYDTYVVKMNSLECFCSYLKTNHRLVDGLQYGKNFYLDKVMYRYEKNWEPWKVTNMPIRIELEDPESVPVVKNQRGMYNFAKNHK